MDKKIVSSHIFIFPFRWDVVKDESWTNIGINDRLNVEMFINGLKSNKKLKWEEDEDLSSIIDKGEAKNDWEYNVYAYFYNNVRTAIYGRKYTKNDKNTKFKIRNTIYYYGKFSKKKSSNRIVSCFKVKNINENSTYNIHILGQEEPYELKIQDIKLKVYDTGIATLSYFLDNYNYKDENDILKINDYGRRIYPQYLSLNNVRNNFLAEKLYLKLQNENIEENFEYGVKNNLSMISKTIMEVLGEEFVALEKELKNKYDGLTKKQRIFIKPVIDDRMFVICYLNSNFHSENLTKIKEDEYLENDFWYQFLFIDNGGATCQDGEMKKKLLEKSTYTRWKNYGTLFGVSRYSFVILCSESDFSENILYNHIKKIYYEMVLLSLVQRASILRFSDETSRISILESKNIYEQIKELQENYIKFVNTIYFREVTAQEQGIELYNKLIEFMRINDEVKRLNEEIDEIQRYISLENEETTNRLINRITFAGIGISILSLISSICGVKEQQNIKWIFEWQIIPFVAIVWIIKISKKVENRNKLGKLFLVLVTCISVLYLIRNYIIK